MKKQLPKGWGKNDAAVKAIQVAFDLEDKISTAIKREAAENNLNPSAQIRKMLNLPHTPPKRPRLTVSLNKEDFEVLGERYDIDPSDELAIRHRIAEEITKLVASK